MDYGDTTSRGNSSPLALVFPRLMSFLERNNA